jgi:hypothetical protein
MALLCELYHVNFDIMKIKIDKSASKVVVVQPIQ